MATPNVGDDPINPKYYDGTACAEIIEHMPTNVGFATKYTWRLGEKDDEAQEVGKAIWYLKRELARENHNRFIYGSWFYAFVSERMRARFEQGKMTFVQSEIIGECAAYCMDGEFRHLERAIILFGDYLGETDENHKQ